MNRLKRSLSLRSSKRHIPESVRPQIWENDSYKVRNGGVSFPVKVFLFRGYFFLYLLAISWLPRTVEHSAEGLTMKIKSAINLKAYCCFSTLDPSKLPNRGEHKFAQRRSERWRRYVVIVVSYYFCRILSIWNEVFTWLKPLTIPLFQI